MRRQLILVFLAVSSMVALAFVVPLAFLVQRTAEDRATDIARADASAIVPALASGGSDELIESVLLTTVSGSRGLTTVLRSNGAVVGNAEGVTSRLRDAVINGSSAIGPTPGGEELVVAIATGPTELSAVRVLIPDADRHHGRDRAWLALFGVGAVLVAISVTVADRLAQAVVRPTQNLASAATRLGDGDLSVRVDPTGPPELHNLATTFNDLGSRIDLMLERERELAAEMSHRLRTPLTRLRLRTEQVTESEIATELTDDVNELTRVVTELINDSRRATDGEQQTCDLTAVATERSAYWRVLAEDQQRPWRETIVERTMQVNVEASDLQAALDVLIENVFRHTDDTAIIEVGTSSAGGSACVWVADGGPGFEPSQARRGESAGGSTGLGLDIARRTATAAGGEMRIGPSEHGGSIVELLLPERSVSTDEV